MKNHTSDPLMSQADELSGSPSQMPWPYQPLPLINPISTPPTSSSTPKPTPNPYTTLPWFRPRSLVGILSYYFALNYTLKSRLRDPVGLFLISKIDALQPRRRILPHRDWGLTDPRWLCRPWLDCPSRLSASLEVRVRTRWGKGIGQRVFS